MHFHTYTTIIRILLTLLGFAALCLTGVDGALLFVIGSVTLASLVINIRYELKITPVIWNILAVLTLIAFVVYYIALSHDLLGSGAIFLAVMVALKLFDLRAIRDHLLLYLLVFLEIVVSAASTVSPVFFAILAAFVIVSIWAMVLFNIRRDYEEWKGKNKIIARRGLLSPTFFLYTIAITTFSLMITLMLFFIIPRAGSGFFQQQTLDALSVPGFADELTLGSIGRGKGYGHVVMRVEFPGAAGPPVNMYIRGTSLDHYDGRNWRRSKSEKKRIEKTSDNLIFSEVQTPGRLFNQLITLEPLDTNILFAASPWSRISGDFKDISTDITGTLYMRNKPYSRKTYSVWSGLGGRERASLSPLKLERYLQLPPPEKEDTGRIKELASVISKDKKNDYKRAKKIENFLRNNYRYTLEPIQTKGKSPLEDFLFYAKEGYCEHYATSMVIMLRTLGIPARVVTGYVQGQWNDFGNYLLLRQMDTHSWVEAYLPYDFSESGEKTRGIDKKMAWVRFDPTASQGLITPRKASRMALYLDSLKWRWTRHIVNYTITDQVKIAISLKHSTRGLRTWLRSLSGRLPGLKRSASQGQTAPLVLALILMGAALIIVIINRGKSRSNIKTPDFYLEMTRILKKKGIERNDSETPLEFARRTRSKEVEKITELFQIKRYRESALSVDELTELKGLIEKVKEELSS